MWIKSSKKKECMRKYEKRILNINNKNQEKIIQHTTDHLEILVVSLPF